MSEDTEMLLIVSLYVVGYGLDPAKVSEALGLEPTRAGQKEGRALAKDGNNSSIRAGYWVLSSKSHSSSVKDHIDDLIGRLPENFGSLSSLSHVDEAFFDIYMAIDADQDGNASAAFDFSSDVISSLSRLGLPVKVTFSSGRP
jgi:hypothetical protein